MTLIPRRRVLAGLIGLVAAPAVVRAASLMPVRAFQEPMVQYWISRVPGREPLLWVVQTDGVHWSAVVNGKITVASTLSEALRNAGAASNDGFMVIDADGFIAIDTHARRG